MIDTGKTYRQAHAEAMQMIERGAAGVSVLAFIIMAAEGAVGEDSVSSILFLDHTGLLRNASSPRLPSDYLKAIDGLRPDAGVGTCAAAAATGKVVFTENFYLDNKWAELRHLPLALGFKSAWSCPVVNSKGNTLGTFGTYFYRNRMPNAHEIAGVKLLANVASIVLEKMTDRN